MGNILLFRIVCIIQGVVVSGFLAKFVICLLGVC